jgi:Protein of unknown function (DUF3300)
MKQLSLSRISANHTHTWAVTLLLLLPALNGCTTRTYATDRTYTLDRTQTPETQSAQNRTYTLDKKSNANQDSFTQGELDSLLAPIALYPDTVLSHLLIASTYPLEVVEADRWVRKHPNLKPEEALNAVDDKDWDPSVKALVAFPEILKRMSDDLDWTQRLGDAFLADQGRVMDSVQTLRNRAYDSGSLNKVENVRVIREEKIIYIEPSVERVVYVPAYDTRVVYGSWWWADYPPVYWHYPSSHVFVSGFYWGPSIVIGPRFYFSACSWQQRRVVVVNHYHNPHTHIYHGRQHFYDSRSVVRHSDARHWHHNPTHRRGVAYYDNNTRERFNSNRESVSNDRIYRTQLRNQPEQPVRRDEQFRQSLQRRQAGDIRDTSPSQSRETRYREAPRREIQPAPDIRRERFEQAPPRRFERTETPSNNNRFERMQRERPQTQQRGESTERTESNDRRAEMRSGRER